MFRMNTGANKQKSKPHADNRSALERAPPILGAFCILLLVIGCAYLVQQADLKLDSQAARATAEKRSRDVAALISSSMNVRLNLTSSLSAFVTTHRKFSPEEFDRFASLLKGDLNGIISLQLAPGGIVTYLTDLERNRKALGHNLLADPKRRAIAEKSIRERSYIIAGPIDLIQGGRAIIARRPIFFPDSTSKTEIFWGFATVLIDIDTLLNDALVAELQDDFDVAIRGKDGLGAKGEVFAGEPSVFDAASAVANIPLPNASWQIAVAKKPEQTPSGLLHSPWYWVFSSMIAIGCSIIGNSIIDRPRQLKRKVEVATETLKLAEEQVRYMAQHDALTDLPNRRLFDELAQKSLAAAKREGVPLATLFIDIDGFKEVNDSLGHQAGDSLLQLFAERLKDRVRESDIVSRHGGDEFVMLLAEKCDVAGAKSAAADVIKAISKPFYVDGQMAEIGVSIGIAIYPYHGTSIGELIQKSDDAMYSAKESGKNCFRLASMNVSDQGRSL